MKSLRIFGILIALLSPLLCVAQYQHQDNGDRRNQGDGDSHGRWKGRLSAEDQSRFDSYYSRWLNYRQSNDREQMASMENRMRDVMDHNSIPRDTDFSRIASPSAGRNSRRDIPRFSGDDARRFRSYYSRWQGYRQTNNQQQVASMEGRMRDVMNHHGIPDDVSYDEVMNMLNRH